jgi:hypothetical protein
MRRRRELLRDGGRHRLNMELDLQSYLGSMSRDVHRCSHRLRQHIWVHMGHYGSAKKDDIS